MKTAQDQSPLAQAFAAIIALLIAAIAEHAREHPLLAGGCRASIRQLEKIGRRLEAMANEWHQSQTQTQARSTRPNPPRPRPPGARPAIRVETKRRADESSRRVRVAMWNPRAPPPTAAGGKKAGTNSRRLSAAK